MRLFFAFVLVLCGYLAGAELAREQKSVALRLKGMRELTEHLLRRSRLTRAPLQAVFCGFSNKELEKAGFLPPLREAKKGIPRVFLEGLELLSLPPQAKEALTELGEELGALPLDEQQKRLELCLEVLIRQEKELESRLKTKTKSIRTSGALFGLLAAIVLV